MYKKFTELLRAKNSTVADLCRATGLKESSLSNWKKRNKGINTDTLIAICKYFNVSSDWFLGLDEDNVNILNAIVLDSDEEKIISAYRKADEGTQKSVCKLLDIKKDLKLSEDVG